MGNGDSLSEGQFVREGGPFVWSTGERIALKLDLEGWLKVKARKEDTEESRHMQTA